MSLNLPRIPYFEIGVKNYMYGDDVLELAKSADRAAIENDIDVLFIAPYADIRRVVENTERLIVLAPYMDTLKPGRGMADVLPESVKAAGASGVVVNHCEKPMTITQIRKTIERAREVDLFSFVCADTIEDAMAVALYHPDIINPEPSDKIGKKSTENDMDFVMESIQAIKGVDPNIIVEQAAGITEPKQVYDLIMAGAEAAGAASGVCCADDPCRMAAEMIAMVRKAVTDLEAREAEK